MLYFCQLHENQEIFSTIVELGIVEFLCALFPYKFCLVLHRNR